MLDIFLKYLNKHELVDQKDHLLLAVSGGIDSVVMTQLFYKAGYQFAIAHCNFQLRGAESEEDQKFVEQLAKKYDCRLFVRRFETKEFCSKKGISVQMGARELRYSWFKELLRKNDYQKIAIAHNKNDIAETQLINLIRGTGLKGLTGIRTKTKHLIRPLLFASREDIEHYAKDQYITFREDSSNIDTKYHRNLIRQEIIPLMQKINPSILDTLIQESEIFDATYQVYKKEIDGTKKAITIKQTYPIELSIAKILSLRLSAPILYELLNQYDFSYSDTSDILNSLTSESGKQFYSDSHILLKDRTTLIIDKTEPESKDEVLDIFENTTSLNEPLRMTLNRQKYDPEISIPDNNFSVCLDYDKLQFPLKLRHWNQGDFFIPLGMKGRKKLSDFFIDNKINRLEKKKIWLLISGSDIVWLIGYQIDDRYKICGNTKNVLTIKVKN
jgi:tRNA(Ile)-lysidine synthase